MVVKLFCSKELMVAKMAQLLHYRDCLTLQEGPWRQVLSAC